MPCDNFLHVSCTDPSQTDLYVSTLRRFVEAMGGERRSVARFPQSAIEINPFQQKPEPVKPEPAEPAAA